MSLTDRMTVETPTNWNLRCKAYGVWLCSIVAHAFLLDSARGVSQLCGHIHHRPLAGFDKRLAHDLRRAQAISPKSDPCKVRRREDIL